MSKKTEQKQEKFVGRRMRLQFDIGYVGDPGKAMDPDSSTMPNMSLTVRQLLEDHTRGQNGNVHIKEPLYFETEIPTIRDITDVKRFREQLEDRLNEVNEFIKNEKSEKEMEKQNKKETGKQLDLEEESKKSFDYDLGERIENNNKS